MHLPRIRTVIFLSVGLWCQSTSSIAQPMVFKKVQMRFNPVGPKREMVERGADLILDDNARMLTIKSGKPIVVDYGSIEKVVFDVRRHMRGGRMTKLLGAMNGGRAGTIGSDIGAAIEAKTVEERLCYLEYKVSGGTTRSLMLVIDFDIADEVTARMQSAFGTAVLGLDFGPHPYEIDKRRLKDLRSKHIVTLDKKNHPQPEVKPDKALVVVVSPSIPGKILATGIQYKLHANDNVVAITKPGAYSF